MPDAVRIFENPASELEEPLDKAYTQLRAKLAAYARRFSIDSDQAADALHDSYIKLHAEHIESEERAAGRLAVTLRNRVVDMLRFRQRRRNVGLEEADCLPAASSEGDTAAHDIIGQMRRCLSPLN